MRIEQYHPDESDPAYWDRYYEEILDITEIAVLGGITFSWPDMDSCEDTPDPVPELLRGLGLDGANYFWDSPYEKNGRIFETAWFSPPLQVVE